MARTISDQVFRAALAKLGSDSDGERINAASIAERWLKQADLTWADVADMLIERNGKPAPTPAPAAQGGAGFGDIFADVFKGSPFFNGGQPTGRAEPKPRPKRYVSGNDVPRMVEGSVQIVDDRPLSGGRHLLVVNLVDEDELGATTVYGPLSVFDAHDIVRCRSGQPVQGLTRQSRDARYNPVLEKVRLL